MGGLIGVRAGQVQHFSAWTIAWCNLLQKRPYTSTKDRLWLICFQMLRSAAQEYTSNSFAKSDLTTLSSLKKRTRKKKSKGDNCTCKLWDPHRFSECRPSPLSNHKVAPGQSGESTHTEGQPDPDCMLISRVAQIHIMHGEGKLNLPCPLAPAGTSARTAGLSCVCGCPVPRRTHWGMRSKGIMRAEILVKPGAKTAGQLQPSTPAKHASLGGFSVPAGGLGRTGTLTSIRLQHSLKNGNPELLKVEKSRRKMWHSNTPRYQTCLACTCSKQLPFLVSMCPVVFTTSKE
ncbi:uncharacterized protein LOC115352650 isoform X1 [Aquila chrysaetos chrysaetos]|uniref:uncharacterized protein LOC115352650 isoform X1 n=1 Tax=Aquila chrysaetos chrysaetos TaxID=223781 RepID=UPI001177084F|nr:uncharacterized protein LOC115352650 isoform X1 [Aquila chrysaetos chrysaetos]XP_029897017.1 uncharacterized protein LOC115352650 isoform X1 [Aquila chrysaetos chrysaetos]